MYMHLDREALLLFSSSTQIRVYLLKARLYYPVVSDLPHVTAVGYDGLHVYWTIGAHEGAGAIMRSKLDGKDQEVLVTAGM